MQAAAPTGQQKQLSVPHTSDVEAVGDELYDGECLKLINEYFYGNTFILLLHPQPQLLILGVRIYPGQDPTHVYIGWVTTQYHLHTKDFNQKQVRTSSIIITDEYERIMDW